MADGKRGARQVARKNAAHIEVHECLAEELKLDEKVDVIVSEWMGASSMGFASTHLK